MVGKVLEIKAGTALVRVGREKMSCLECRRECALAKGEPTVEVASRPGLRVGQVVNLADNRALMWWLKSSLFFIAFVVAAMAGGTGLRAAGVAAADKWEIVIGLIAGGLVLGIAQRLLRVKHRYAIVEILRTENDSNQ
jgi:hypothetical protein